ncbi:MAG: HAD-IIB family hydrolase [Bacilli bacterium]
MKILVSDFDLTFYTNDYKKNIEKVNEFVSKGNIFIIATGRPFYFLMPSISDVHINYSYLICSDGTIVFDKSEQIVIEERIDNSTIKKITTILESSDAISNWYNNEPLKYSNNIENPSNGLLGVPKDRDKAIILVNEINKNFPDIKAYLSHNWINILNKESSKASAIKKLVELNNWELKDVITVGDNYNDIEMNENFESYAVKTAPEELKKVSKHQVLDFIDALKKIG